MDNMNFEAMYARLEIIAKDIQNESLSLDAVHKLYTEGMSISKKCIAYIEELKREVEIAKTNR
jgi:exodeoxyribonuclease VII small subunit